MDAAAAAAPVNGRKDGLHDDDEDAVAVPSELPFAAPLSHELFGILQDGQDDFDASHFLLSRKHVNLDDLRSELRTYLASLRQQLVSIINTDYEDFINLGRSQLLGSDDQMSYRMRKPLEGISGEISEAMDELVAIRAGLESRLNTREEIRSRKAMCRKLLGVNEQTQKVEDMLLIPSSAGRAGDGPADEATRAGLKVVRTAMISADKDSRVDRSMGSETKRIERIAQEYNQLLYLVRKSEGLKFVTSLQPRIDRISVTLQHDLNTLLSASITTLNSPLPNSSLRDANAALKARTEAVSDLFRTYASIGKFREAEDVIRKQVVTEFVTKTIHREALLSPQSPMMPITPYAPLTGAISPSTPSFPFSPISPFPSSLIDDRSMIPPFYIMDPIQAAPSPSNADTFISDALVELYNKLLLFISKDLGTILEVCERRPAQGREAFPANISKDGDLTVPGSPSTRERNKAMAGVEKSGYEILSNVIWTEIANRITSELGHLIFTAGRPDQFHRNYLATMSFINRLESICPNHRYLNILRNNSSYIAFLRRWQLPVYFQLRFKEIVSTLENTLSINVITAAPSAVQSTSLIMAASEAVHRAIYTCWNEDVFLQELAGRFWKLTLQLVHRYRTWLQSNLPDHATSAAISISAANPASGASSAMNGSGLNLQRLLPNGLNTPNSRPATPNPQPTNASDEQSDELALRQLSIVVSDAHTFRALVLQLFTDRILPKLPALGTGESVGGDVEEDDPEAVLASALTTITSMTASLLVQIVTILSKRCSEPLRLVRSGASQVRATSKSKTNSAPTEPSYFVPNILRPARAFLDAPGKALSAATRQQLAVELFEDLAVRYEAAVSKMKKDDDALRRLKRGKAGFSLFGSRSPTTDDAANTSDSEKVRQQMHVDVEAFASDAKSLGVDLEASNGLRALRKVIEEWNV